MRTAQYRMHPSAEPTLTLAGKVPESCRCCRKRRPGRPPPALSAAGYTDGVAFLSTARALVDINGCVHLAYEMTACCERPTTAACEVNAASESMAVLFLFPFLCLYSSASRVKDTANGHKSCSGAMAVCEREKGGRRVESAAAPRNTVC